MNRRTSNFYVNRKFSIVTVDDDTTLTDCDENISNRVCASNEPSMIALWLLDFETLVNADNILLVFDVYSLGTIGHQKVNFGVLLLGL